MVIWTKLWYDTEKHGTSIYYGKKYNYLVHYSNFVLRLVKRYVFVIVNDQFEPQFVKVHGHVLICIYFVSVVFLLLSSKRFTMKTSLFWRESAEELDICSLQMTSSNAEQRGSSLYYTDRGPVTVIQLPNIWWLNCQLELSTPVLSTSALNDSDLNTFDTC